MSLFLYLAYRLFSGLLDFMAAWIANKENTSLWNMNNNVPKLLE